MQNIEEISRIAAVNCVAIYNDFSEQEVNEMPSSIRKAWKTGLMLVKRQEMLDAQAAHRHSFLPSLFDGGMTDVCDCGAWR